MAPELEAICGKEENGITRQMRLGYAIDLAVAQIADGRLRQAACTLHPVINDHRPGFRNDLLCIARMLRLMIHYDLGDIELLPYLIRSTYRFIARCRGISELDRAVLGFLRRLPNLATRDGAAERYTRRRPLYTAMASHTIDCGDLTAEETAAAILSLL